MELLRAELKNVMARFKKEPQKSRLEIRAVKLSNEETKSIQDAFPQITRLTNIKWLVKVEPAIKKGYVDAKAIRVYVSELMKEIDSTTERGEKPVLLLKKSFSKKRDVHEYEIVFCGTESERHVEELIYFQKHPSTWKTWGDIILSKEQLKQMIATFQDLLEDS